MDNHLDGIDIAWHDHYAMIAGTGEQWLIDCTIAIREVLPLGEYLVTHALPAAYFAGSPTN